MDFAGSTQPARGWSERMEGGSEKRGIGERGRRRKRTTRAGLRGEWYWRGLCGSIDRRAADMSIDDERAPKYPRAASELYIIPLSFVRRRLNHNNQTASSHLLPVMRCLCVLVASCSFREAHFDRRRLPSFAVGDSTRCKLQHNQRR